MNRDCGKGELIPHKWEVVFCKGLSDTEVVQGFDNFDMALGYLDTYLNKLPAHSDIRLYAKDKQGYANCILYYRFDQTAHAIKVSDRTAEISTRAC